MRDWIAVAAMLASLAVAAPALATPRVSGPSAAVSDTDRTPRVHRAGAPSERWECSKTVCQRVPSSPWSTGLGFAATAFAAAGISRRRSSAIP